MDIFDRSSVAILVVCTANICRSPMAAGILREELKLRGVDRKVRVASAGTHVTLPGHAADARAQLVCAREGIDLRKSRARQATPEELSRFDFILAMDQRNYQWQLEASLDSDRGKITLLGSWADAEDVGEISDPYYGSQTGFEEVLQQLHPCLKGFIAYLVEQAIPPRD